MWWLILLIASQLWASTMEDSYTQGKELAQQLSGQVKNTIENTAPSKLPGYQSGQPQEAGLSNQGNLSDAANNALKLNAGGQSVITSAATRESFVLDVKTDPLFAAKPDAEKMLGIHELKDEAAGFIKKTCEEGGEAVVYECVENRHVVPQVPKKTLTLTVNHLAFIPRMESYEVQTRSGGFFRHGRWETRQRQNGWTITLPKDIKAFKEQFCKGFTGQDCITKQVFRIDCNYIQGFKVNSGSITENDNMLTIVTNDATLNITLEHKTYEGEAIDAWTGCAHWEQKVDDGLCEYKERILTQGSGIRNINGYQIFKDAWQYKNIYNCKMIKDECSLLRAQGCYQVASRCKEYKQHKCWIYEQDYHCPDGRKTLGKYKAPQTAFCLTGNCHNASYEANSEMLDAISRLSVLKEMQNDLRANKHDVRIFKGNSYQCRRDCLSFKDCCGGMKGWGVALKLTNCKPEEQQLAKMRQQSLCHQVGSTFCARKVLGQCVQKLTSFCCFGNKFAKIVQEQGRKQLAINWGHEKCPDCRALTITELSKLDLAKMDFSEVFADIMHKYQAPNVPVLQERVKQRIDDNLNKIADSLKTDKPQAATGVVYDEADGL